MSPLHVDFRRMMPAHPGEGEKESQLPQRTSGREGQPGLFVFESDSLTCHHIVEMFISEEGMVLLINHTFFEILLNLGVKQVSSKQVSNLNHLNLYKQKRVSVMLYNYSAIMVHVTHVILASSLYMF